MPGLANTTPHCFISPLGRWRGSTLIACLIVALSSHPASAIPTQYELIDLGTLGGDYSHAFDVSDTGFVVGESRLANGEIHAFRWHNGVMLDLGLLGGATRSRAVAVNDYGEVVGNGDRGTFLRSFDEGFYFDGTTSVLLPGLNARGGYPFNKAGGISNTGVVVGEAKFRDDPGFDSVIGAYTWTPGGGIKFLEGVNTFEAHINTRISDDGNWIVYRDRLDGELKMKTPASTSPVPVNENGYHGRPVAVNNNGFALTEETLQAGMLDLSTGEFLHTQQAGGSLSVGEVVDFMDINNNNEALIRSNIVAPGSGPQPALLVDGEHFRLTDRIVNLAGWSINTHGFSAINDKGWVVGSATNKSTGERHAILLKGVGEEADPVPTRGGGNNFAAELTTGSPVTLSQAVDVPATSTSLTFDYLFLTASGELSVTLDGMLLGTITNPGAQTDFLTTTFAVDGSLLGMSGLDLAFTFDGPTGSRIQIDNVLFPGIVNGDFETGDLTGWSINASPGANAQVVALTVVPEPATAALSLLASGVLVVCYRRRGAA